jgi:ABC-2 type transport system permease protein
MTMNIFLRELRSSIKSLLIWAGIILLFSTIGFSKFSAYEGNPELLAILDSMPQAVLSAFNFEAFNLTTVTGFFGVMFTYYALILSIAAVMWGSECISKEERDKTVEFALTLPVTRGRLVTAKTLAALVDCFVLLLLTWGFVLLNARAYQTDSLFYEFVSRSMAALFIMQMIFLAIGVFLGSSLKRYKRASSVAVSVLLATYFISVLYGLDADLDFLKYFSPFTYFNPGALLREARLDPLFVGLSFGIIITAMAGAYVAYSKRDLYL